MLKALIEDEFKTLHILREGYPFLFNEGIADFEGSIHSIFLSYLVTLGIELGNIAIADYPILDCLKAKILQQERALRPDSVWIDKGNMDVNALIEFERASPGSSYNLVKKLINLAICQKHKGNMNTLLLLIYWHVTKESVDIDPVKSIIGKKRSDNGILINIPKDVIVYKALFRENGDKLRFIEMTRTL